MSRTMNQDNVYVYDGCYFIDLVCAELSLAAALIVGLYAVRMSIYTSTWAVVDGKRFLSPRGI